MLRRMRWSLALAVVVLASGCSSLLPSSKKVTASPWESYRDAQLTFDKIIPGMTTELELKELHLDPQAYPNIAILNYSDVLLRFMPHASITADDLDPAVRECLSAKILCKGFQVSQSNVRRHREGNFFADVLGFNRETRITGWEFNALLLLKNGVVVYKLTGGKPSIAEHEENRNPLGPVQSIGQKFLGF
jgi:hypothetical protein